MQTSVVGKTSSVPRADHHAGSQARDMRLAIAGIVLYSVAYILSEIYDVYDLPNALLTLGSLKIYPNDIVAVILLGVGLFRIMNKKALNPVEITLLLLLALSVVHFAFDLSIWGSAAGVDFRDDFLVLAGIIFMTQLSLRFSAQNLLIIVGIFTIACVFVYMGRYTGVIAMSTFTKTVNLGSFREFRYIGAGESLVVFEFAVICLVASLSRRDPRVAIPLFVLGIAAIIFAFMDMHRSVWAVAVTSFLLYSVLIFRFRHMSLYSFVLFVGISSACGLLVYLGTQYLGNVQEAVSEVSSSNSTMEWRIQGWVGLLAQMSPFEMVIGKGYGANTTRIIGAELLNVSAHNFLLDKLWTLGIAGPVLYGTFIWQVLARLIRTAERSVSREYRVLAIVLMTLIGGLLVYSVVYVIKAAAILILGYSISFVSSVQVPLRRPSTALARH